MFLLQLDHELLLHRLRLFLGLDVLLPEAAPASRSLIFGSLTICFQRASALAFRSGPPPPTCMREKRGPLRRSRRR